MIAGRTPLASISAAALAALLCVATIFYVHRESPRTLVSAHGLLHTSIAQRFASASLRTAPPENPFFAGARVPYYWVFQYCGARLSQLLDVHPLHAFEWMILAAMCVLWLAAASLGHRLYGGVIPGLAIGLLALGGTNPFGVAILLGKIALRGPAPLRDDPGHFWGLVHPVMSAARLNDPFNLYGPFINFFFNITSRPIALTLVLVMALCTFTWLRQGSFVSWLGIALSTAVSTAFSVAIGAPAALALSAALVAVAWLPLDGSDGIGRRLCRVRALWGGGGLVLGVGLAAPTYLHLLLGEAEREVGLDLSLSAMVRAGASAGLLLAMACVGALRHSGGNQRFLVGVLIAGLGLVAVGTVLELPVENHCNLFQAGAFLLAVPAAGSVVPSPSWSPTRVWLTWLAVVIVFIPTTLLVMFAHLHRPPIELAFQEERLNRVPADSPLARLYDWVRTHTAPDAVFILDPGPPFTTAVGNMPEFPALTERVQFTSYPSSYMVAPHRDARLRDTIARRLLAGGALDAGERDYLGSLGRPLYLVVDFAHASGAEPALRQRFGEALFRQADMALFAVDPARTMGQLPGGVATYSTNFPVTADAAQATNQGHGDLFAVKLSAALSQVLYGTYLGGTGTDSGGTSAVDPSGNLIVTGGVTSRDWPLSRPLQPRYSGGSSDGVLGRPAPVVESSNGFSLQSDLGSWYCESGFLSGGRGQVQ